MSACIVTRLLRLGLEPDVGYQAGWCRVVGGFDVAFPENGVAAQLLACVWHTRNDGVEYFKEVGVGAHHFATPASGSGHGNVVVALRVEQKHLRGLVVGGRPEGAVKAGQVRALAKHLGYFTCGNTVLIKLDAERHRKRMRLPEKNIGSFLGQGFEEVKRRALVAEQLAFDARVSQGVEESFLFLDVFHQAGKVQSHGIVLFFDQTLK
ncbi:hypothetical protein D3C77_433690 [compost metagenome]